MESSREILTVELGETEQSRDDLVVYVADLNETIANLELEKKALNEKIASVENERDDLMVVVVDLKETIDDLSNKKQSLEEKITSTEEERDDFLVICADLEETIEGLNREHINVSLGKGKKVASESHILLEKELTIVKTSLCKELERNQQLQAELEKVRVQCAQKNKAFTHRVTTSKGPGSSERKQTAMDCGQWMLKARNIMNFFSLKALQEGNVNTHDDHRSQRHSYEQQGGELLKSCSKDCFGIRFLYLSKYYDLIKDHTRSLTPRVLEAPEDDFDQYLNTSMLDSMTLKESPEKEATHNIMVISAKSLMDEGAYLSSEYQGEDLTFLGDKSKRSVKIRKKRKINPKDFIKSVPVNQIDKDASREPGSLVQQSMIIKENIEE
ncbi:uncharacterized protein [Nicotiana sylvestris]|uniref:uncharacterized protein n=1 Tax=Nicotiana sylvestris TaxID=4096 RepID=UPI00388C8F89